MVRSMEGQGRRITRYPPDPGGTGSPPGVTISTLIPGSGRVHEPGFVGVAPGNGLIMIAPVSVCHHVSTTGHRSRPMCSQYQTQASGLIGSPTEPSRRRELRSCASGCSLPHFMNVRIAVGAVYRIVTPYCSTIAQKRSLPG